MSASLVGSEMCIRDRGACIASGLSAVALHINRLALRFPFGYGYLVEAPESLVRDAQDLVQSVPPDS
eukprot:3593853-Alexandrium_andersonii.AAC.1